MHQSFRINLVLPPPFGTIAAQKLNIQIVITSRFHRIRSFRSRSQAGIFLPLHFCNIAVKLMYLRTHSLDLLLKFPDRENLL